MPDYRTHTLVADRSDVDFHKQPDPLRANRRKWIVLAGLLGFWPLVWQLAGRNDQTIYWAHTVSTSHQMVQHNCQKCHREWCQTFRMNFMSSQEIRIIEANTCQSCHWEDTRDHSSHLVAREAVGCFDCHAEHRRRASLNLVADVYCTDCHRDLRIQAGEEILPSTSFTATIPSFYHHPEFAVRRPRADLDLKALEHGSHKVLVLAVPPETGEDGDGKSSLWRDRANFTFNHAKHLLKAGVGIPPGHPLNIERKAQNQQPLPTKVLSCADCHELDAGGEYFRPINYERHCADCHELSFSEELSEVRLGETGVEPLPHERPEIIRGTLRDRLTVFITNHPERLNPEEEEKPDRLPHKKSQEKKTATFQEKADWVEQQLTLLESIVQGRDAGAKFRVIQKGCSKCHHIQDLETSRGINWEIRPPNIPERWLPHSRFRHDRHDMLECFDCHYNKPPGEPSLENYRDDPGSIFKSETAADILMPSIETCRKCHGSPVGTPWPGRVMARAECTECHQYHHTLSMTPEIRELWDRKDGVSDVAERLWRKREVPVSREQLLKNLPQE